MITYSTQIMMYVLIDWKLGIYKRKTGKISLVYIRYKRLVTRRQPGGLVREFGVKIVERSLRFLQRK